MHQRATIPATILFLVISVVALGSCSSGTPDAAKSTSASLVTTSAPTTTTTVVIPTTTTAASTTTEIPTTTTTIQTVFKWDTTAEVDGLRITVSPPARDSNLYAKDEQGRRADATMKVFGAKVILENVTETAHIYSAMYFVLLDSDGNTYLGYDEDSSSYGKHVAMRSGYLEPGKKITRWLNYVVPIAATAESIWYSKDGTFGLSIQAQWQK